MEVCRRPNPPQPPLISKGRSRTVLQPAAQFRGNSFQPVARDQDLVAARSEFDANDAVIGEVLRQFRRIGHDVRFYQTVELRASGRQDDRRRGRNARGRPP